MVGWLTPRQRTRRATSDSERLCDVATGADCSMPEVQRDSALERSQVPLVRDCEITKVMATDIERNWTAHLVLSSEHAGLRPHFKALEDEIYRVLARIDDPREVRHYLQTIREVSRMWLEHEIELVVMK